MCLALSLLGCKAEGLNLTDPEPEKRSTVIEKVVDAEDMTTVGEENIEVPLDSLVNQRLSIGVARNETVEEYLNSVLAKIQRAWPSENAPSHVFLIPSTEFKAYYHKGGIFISHGMLNEMESEDEVAACVAHEYAHGLLGHESLSDGSILIDRLHGVANVYLALKFTENGAQNSLEYFAINKAVNEASQSILLPAFSREQEDDADELATDLLIRAGYNAIAMTYLLQRVQDWESRNAERAEANRDLISEIFSANTVSNGGDYSQAFSMSLNTIFEKVGQELLEAYNTLKREHYPASDREGNVKSYLREFYPDFPRHAMKERELKEVLSTRQAKSLMSGLALLDTVDRDVVSNDRKAAQKHVTKACSLLNDGVAYARHMAYSVAKTSNDDSAQLLEVNCQKEDSLLRDHEMLVQLYEDKNPEKALDIAKGAYATFNEPEQFLPTLVRLSAKTGHKIRATAYMADCLFRGDLNLATLCTESMK